MHGRFHRVLIESSSDDIVAYLLCAWQYLDLHVLKIGVLPEFRHRGLASALMKSAERELRVRGGESIILEVRESNEAAVGLYGRLGYGEIGRRERYYGDGENAIVMRKTLEEKVV